MHDKIRVLIIDDESLARELVRKYLSDNPDIEILGECENGFDALKAIRELKPDLLFLDIQMPRIDGFELLEVLDPQPEIIFTTAFDQYAIRAFEMNAVDYLLKPFSKTRLEQAVEKARGRILSTPDASSAGPSIQKLQQQIDNDKKIIERVVTRMGSKITVIPVDKIWYIEAADDYVMIWSESGNHLKEKTMKYFEEHLPEGQFIRTHRSHIINISQVVSLELYSKDSYIAIMKSGAKLKVSAEGYRRLKEKF
ncbi:MAG: response regulator [Bacteroidales bacterium]|nr:response regulator [Bacteroidales bacterium]